MNTAYQHIYFLLVFKCIVVVDDMLLCIVTFITINYLLTYLDVRDS